MTTVDDLLAAARVRLDRVSPVEAAKLAVDGALLVDTRPQWQRADEGTLPGALVIERNYLEWRLDPASDARIPQAIDHDVTSRSRRPPEPRVKGAPLLSLHDRTAMTRL